LVVQVGASPRSIHPASAIEAGCDFQLSKLINLKGAGDHFHSEDTSLVDAAQQMLHMHLNGW
jgi:hypothetical protein